MNSKAKIKATTIGLAVSVLLMVLTIPYTAYEYFDATIPFDRSLLFFSGISIFLFAINYYYHKSRK